MTRPTTYCGTPPVRSAQQRLDALEEANRIRFHRAERKGGVRSGRLEYSDLLADEDFATLPVRELLAQVPGYGEVKVSKVLKLAQLSPYRKIGALTERERAALKAATDLIAVTRRPRQPYVSVRER
jgi:hypothetical protein